LIPKVLCIFGSYHLRILHFSSKLYFYHVLVTRCLEQRKNYQKRKRTEKGSTDNILITKIVNLSVYGFYLREMSSTNMVFSFKPAKKKRKKGYIVVCDIVFYSIQFLVFGFMSSRSFLWY
jgi:hypothetical protein